MPDLMKLFAVTARSSESSHLQRIVQLGGKKRKDYAFWRQFNEKPSVIPGCPGS